MRAPTDAAAKEGPPNANPKRRASPPMRSPRELDNAHNAGEQAGGGGGHIPGSVSAVMATGPRYRIAEAEMHQLKQGHAREMKALRDYVDALRAYGERMRHEVDKYKGELAATQEELRARPSREH